MLQIKSVRNKGFLRIYQSIIYPVQKYWFKLKMLIEAVKMKSQTLVTSY